MIPNNDLQRQIADLQSGDPKRRDKVLKALYESPMVAAKAKAWNQQYADGKLDVPDILQESILLFFEKVRSGEFRGDSKLTTYLLKICQNKIRNAGRSKRVRQTDSIDAPESTTLPLGAELLSTTIEEEEAAQQIAHRNKLLRSVLAKLTENCQSAIALYYSQNKSTQQVAEIKQLANPRQAKKLIHRCRERLRQLIGENTDLNNYLKMNR